MHARIPGRGVVGLGRCRAFTLIELLMVIVLIGILIGILLPVLYKTKRNAKIKQADATIRQVTLAMRNYHFESRKWPVPDPRPPDETYINNNYQIIAIMTNCQPPLFDVGQHLRDAQGNLIDPWGSPYSIMVDKDYNGKYQDTEQLIPNGVLVTSPNL